MWPFSGIIILSNLALELFSPSTQPGLRHHADGHLAEAHIRLIPAFDSDSSAATGINISMILRAHKARQGEVLITLPLGMGPTPSARYDGDAITATDGLGPLPLRIRDEPGPDPWREWLPRRDPEGAVELSFFAPPREVNKSTRAGPRIDLQATQGGLFGKGFGFLPYPPAQEDWNIVVAWDLQHAPEGTKVAWSIGDDPVLSAIGWPNEIIGNTFYAVGPLSRWPDWDSSATPEARCKTYWIGDPPWNMASLAPETNDIFEAISRFFPGTDEDRYAVFFRQVPNSSGGTGGRLSFLIEYQPGGGLQQHAESPLSQMLAHEILHSYPIMPFEDTEANGWYIEGVAEYYSILLLYRAGLLGREEFVKRLNGKMQGYYTNPFVRSDLEDVIDRFWDDVLYTRVPYARGFLYLLQANGLVVETTEGLQSVDDVVLDLYDKQTRREPHDSDVFVRLLGKVVGRGKAKTSFERMWRGNLLVPSPGSLSAYGLQLRRKDCLPFEVGFEYRSGYVRGLVAGSRAEAAGVREGDEILESLDMWAAADGYEEMIEAILKRNETVERVRWWPRGHSKVQCWWWEDSEAWMNGEL